MNALVRLVPCDVCGIHRVAKVSTERGLFDVVCDECTADLASSPSFDNRRSAFDDVQCRECGCAFDVDGTDLLCFECRDERVLESARQRGARRS